jgi:GntR family transcriptional regulator
MQKLVRDQELRVPLYQQLRLRILERIESGDYPVGSQLPPGAELAEQYGVSLQTVRDGLAELVRTGHLDRFAGRGTFVKQPPAPPESAALSLARSFTTEVALHGLKPSSTVIAQEIVTHSPDVAVRMLHLEPGSRVFRLARVRRAGEEPIGYEEVFLKADHFPGIERIDFAGASLMRTLRDRYGYAVKRLTQELCAVAADSQLSRYLEVDEGSPLLRCYEAMHGVGDTDKGEPLVLTIGTFNTARHNYSVTIQAED